jgi:hypothetical protein
MKMFCTYCNRPDLTSDDFYFDKSKDNFSKRCKQCTMAYRAQNKEKINDYRRKYYKRNADKLRKQSRDFYHNKDEYREKRLEQFSTRYKRKVTGKRFNSEAHLLAPIVPDPLDPTLYEGLLDPLKDARSKKALN